MGTKRVLLIGDTHCGSEAGVDPWDQSGSDPDLYAFRRGMWDWLAENLEEDGPFHLAILGGDLIDGSAPKDEGCGELTTNPVTQAKMAADVIRQIKAKHFRGVYGTAYHVGKSCDFEDVAFREADLDPDWIKGQIFAEVNGVVFDVKHHGGRSSIPYGMNAAQKDHMWNIMNATLGREPIAAVVARFHTHLYRLAENEWGVSVQCPCLQGPFTKYGRRCGGNYSMGYMVFDVTEKGEISWTKRILDLPQLRKNAETF